jgi:hypothetical protein
MQVLPAGLPKVDGVISLKSFREHIITVDLNGGLLIVKTISSTRDRKKTGRPFLYVFPTDWKEMNQTCPWVSCRRDTPPGCFLTPETLTL